MNLPNTLSVMRIILAPVFMALFLSDTRLDVLLSFFVFTIAALTDWYDGWYARKYGFKTRWGQFIDPLADKVLTSSAFIAFYLLKQKDTSFLGTTEFIPLEILIGVILFRDIVLTAARSIQELRGREFKTSMISKTKTFIQMTFIFLIIGVYALASFIAPGGFSQALLRFLHSDINYYVLLLVTLLTTASGVAYIVESSPGRHKTGNEKKFENNGSKKISRERELA